MVISETVAAAAGALGLSKVSAGCRELLAETLPSYRPLLDRVTDRPTNGDHPSTLVSYCQHSGLLR